MTHSQNKARVSKNLKLKDQRLQQKQTNILVTMSQHSWTASQRSPKSKKALQTEDAANFARLDASATTISSIRSLSLHKLPCYILKNISIDQSFFLVGQFLLNAVHSSYEGAGVVALLIFLGLALEILQPSTDAFINQAFSNCYVSTGITIIMPVIPNIKPNGSENLSV